MFHEVMLNADEEGKEMPSISNMVVEPLKKLTSEVMANKKLTELSTEIFKQVSLVLSSLLPPVLDSTLFEVDDLLYSSDRLFADTNFLGSYKMEKLSPEIQDCLPSYCTIYMFIIVVMKVEDHILDTTYLQLIQHMPMITIDVEYHYNVLLLCVNRLLSSRCYVNICRALKLLAVAIKDKNFEKLLKFKARYSCKALFLSKLKDIPASRYPDKNRVTSWMASQAAALLRNVDFNQVGCHTPTRSYIELYLSTGKKNFEQTIGAHINSLMESISYELEFESIGFKQDGITFHLAHLHDYLTSTRADDVLNQNLRRHSVSDGCLHQGDDLTVTDLLIKRCGSFVKYFYYFLEYLVKEVHYPNDLLNNIDKHGYDCEPHLSNNSPNSSAEIIKGQQNIQNEGGSSDVQDYMLERFLVLDEFKKSLEVMNILYVSRLAKAEWFMEARNNPLKKYIFDVLKDQSKQGLVPWWIYKTVEQCSFMVLSDHLDYLKEDLVRMLRGENIDVVTRESIYFAINATNDGDQFL